MTGNSTQSASVTGTSVAVLKQIVSKLSQPDLDELYTHITILRRLGGKPKSKFTASGAEHADDPTDRNWQERVLYDALAAHVAHQLGSSTAMPLSAFRKTAIYSQWCQALTKTLIQHQTWFAKASRTETISMLRLYADMIIANLNSPEHQHGFGWRSVCWGMENLAVIVDRNFPDYARNGLLPLVATLRTAPREQK